MPIIDHFERVLGDSPQALAVPEGSDAGLLICFVSSTDPATKQPWCSDHRAAIPVLEATFAKESQPEVRLVHVGQRTESVHSSFDGFSHADLISVGTRHQEATIEEHGT